MFRKSSPRGRRVDLEERQEVAIGRLLDQVRLGRGGEPADLAESARRCAFLLRLRSWQLSPLLLRTADDLADLFQVGNWHNLGFLTVAEVVQLVASDKVVPRLLDNLRK